MSDTPSALDRPLQLIPALLYAFVALATVHLLIDATAFGDGLFGTLAGLMTDLKTLVTGFAVLVGLAAVLGSTGAELIDRYRDQPTGRFLPLIYTVAYVGLLHVIVAQLIHRSDESAFLISVFGHDVFFLGVAMAIIIALAVAAAARVDLPPDRAEQARQVALIGVYGAVGGGVAYVLFRFFDVVGEDGTRAIADTAYALLEVIVGVSLAMAALTIVHRLAPPPEQAPDRFTPSGMVGRRMNSQEPLSRRVLTAVGAIGAVYVLFLLLSAGDTRGSIVLAQLVAAAFDVTLALALVYVIGSMWPGDRVLFDEPERAPDTSLVRSGVVVIGAVGLLSAIVSYAAFNDFGAAEAWYYVFNRLVRAAAGVGALVALWALRAGVDEAA